MTDTVRTQTALLTTLFQDGQAPGSISAQDMRDLIVSLRNNQGGGWSMHTDSTYTAGSPLSIPVDTRTKLTIDGLGSDTNTTYAPPDGAIWDSINNRLTPNVVGSAFDLRLSIFSSYDSGASAKLDLEIDIGGSIGNVYIQHNIFAKGPNETNEMAWSVPIFTLDTFVANGGTLYITPRESAIKIWNIKLMITQTFKPTV